MRCCICGEDQTGRPVVQDNVTGAVYCYTDREFSFSLKDRASFSTCRRCGFKYSASYSAFARGDAPTCPQCGANLKPAPASPEVMLECVAILSAQESTANYDEVLRRLKEDDAAATLIAILHGVVDHHVRLNLIGLLKRLGDPRAVPPLVECYDMYKSFEDAWVGYAERHQVDVPPRYLGFAVAEQFVPLWQAHGSKSLLASPEFQSHLTYVKTASLPLMADSENDEVIKRTTPCCSSRAGW